MTSIGEFQLIMRTSENGRFQRKLTLRGDVRSGLR